MCFLAFSDRESLSSWRFFLSYFTQEVKPIYVRSSRITNSTETLIPLNHKSAQFSCSRGREETWPTAKEELSANRAQTAFNALRRDISLGKRSVLVRPETAPLSAVLKPTGLRALRQDPRWADKTTSSGKPPRHHLVADTTAASKPRWS